MSTISGDSATVPISLSSFHDSKGHHDSPDNKDALAQSDSSARTAELEQRCAITEREAEQLRSASSASDAIDAARRSERSRLEAQGQRALLALEARDAELTRTRQELADARSKLASPSHSKALQTQPSEGADCAVQTIHTQFSSSESPAQHNSVPTPDDTHSNAAADECSADEHPPSQAQPASVNRQHSSQSHHPQRHPQLHAQQHSLPTKSKQQRSPPSQNSHLPSSAFAECGVQAQPSSAEVASGDYTVHRADAMCMTEQGEALVETGVQAQAAYDIDAPSASSGMLGNQSETSIGDAYHAAARHERAADEEAEQAREEAEEARGEAERALLLLRERDAQVKTLQDALTAIEEEGGEESLEGKLAAIAQSEAQHQGRNSGLQKAQTEERLRAESAERARDRALERAQRAERRVTDLEGTVRSLESKLARLNADGLHTHVHESQSPHEYGCPDAIAEETMRVWLEHEIKRLRASIDTLRLMNASDGDDEETGSADGDATDAEKQDQAMQERGFMLRASDSQVRRRASVLARRVRELEGLPQGEQGQRYAEEAARVAKREMQRRIAAERGIVPETRERGTMCGEHLPSQEACIRWRALRETLSRRKHQKLMKEAQTKQKESEDKTTNLNARLEELRQKESEHSQREEEMKRRLRSAEEDSKRKDDLVRAAKQRAEQLPQVQSQLESERNRRSELEHKLKNALHRQALQQTQQQQQQLQQQEQERQKQRNAQDDCTRKGNRCSGCERKRLKEKELRAEIARLEARMREHKQALSEQKQLRPQIDQQHQQLERQGIEGSDTVKRNGETAPRSDDEAKALIMPVLSLAKAATSLSRSVRESVDSTTIAVESSSQQQARSLGLSTDEVHTLLSNPSLLSAEDALKSLEQKQRDSSSERQAALGAIERELQSCRQLLLDHGIDMQR